MEEIVKTIIISLCSIIAAISGFVIAWLHKKTKQLEAEKIKSNKEKENLRTEIKTLHNGFREYVYNELVVIKKKVEHLEDKKLCIKCKRDV